MDKNKLLERFNDKKVQDYTFNTLFFLIFSFFLYFAIRPNVITVFSLQQELQDLRLRNKESEAVIMKIVNYQTLLENYRDEMPLLDEALPSSPGLAKAVEDIRKTASSSGLLVVALSVEQVVFHDANGTGDLQNFNISLSSGGTVQQLNTFFAEVLKQRRLKVFENVSIGTDPAGRTEIKLIIKTYYL